MADTFKLKRTVQCAKCPWRVTTNPFEIPHGYDLEKHRALACTIAQPGALTGNGRAMACQSRAARLIFLWLTKRPALASAGLFLFKKKVKKGLVYCPACRYICNVKRIKEHEKDHLSKHPGRPNSRRRSWNQSQPVHEKSMGRYFAPPWCWHYDLQQKVW